MAYKFLKVHQLRQLLDDSEVKQKKDIYDFSGGHLNESILLQHHSTTKRKPWSAAKKPESMLARSWTGQQPSLDQKLKMENVLFEFTMGTTGVIPKRREDSKLHSPIKKYKFLKAQKSTTPDEGSISTHSIYSEIQDDILVEELPTHELMLKTSNSAHACIHKTHSGMAASKHINGMAASKLENGFVLESTVLIPQTPLNSHSQEHTNNNISFNYDIVPMHSAGITRYDQYRKLRSFEDTVLHKKDASEQKVLSGIKAVEHLEKKLSEDLETLNLSGGPNFHKLQVYSNTLEELITDSATFGYILRNIKTEYDNYIAWLLDNQTSQQHVLREQVVEMTARGTSRPAEMAQAKDRITQLNNEAKNQLKINTGLREAVKEQHKWLENAPEPPTENTSFNSSLLHKDTPMELADEIENTKALMLEKLDELNALRVCLREEFVPMTVCTHLEQCIKETEVEVQKLLKQNEYFERSISEMEGELKEAIVEADTSEKDARRIWRKVNSTRGIPGQVVFENHQESDSEEEEEECKWNWYIS